MKIYISGPMTGMPDNNKPAFFAAEETLRALGYEPVNPARNGLPETATWEEHMRADIKMLMDCEALCFLPGSGASKGASIEMELAGRLGMKCEALSVIVARARWAV